MSVIGLIGAGVGLASSLYGAHKSAKAAREQERELAKQRAANEAWYNRNYYQDYMNTVEAQNALKQYRNAWAERTKSARARQAITGGTPEQAAAVAEAGGEAMGNMIGNLAAQGQQNKAAIDAQKLAMDTNLSNQQAAIAEARQTAASNLMSGGASLIANSLPGLTQEKTTAAPTETPKTEVPITAPTKAEVTAPAGGMMDARVNPVQPPVENGIVVPESKKKYKPYE
jgi:hypothetical protein